MFKFLKTNKQLKRQLKDREEEVEYQFSLIEISTEMMRNVVAENNKQALIIDHLTNYINNSMIKKNKFIKVHFDEFGNVTFEEKPLEMREDGNIIHFPDIK